MIIELNGISGDPVYIFTEHIVAIQKNDKKGTNIYMNDSDPTPFIVKNDVADVIRKITRGVEEPKKEESGNGND